MLATAGFYFSFVFFFIALMVDELTAINRKTDSLKRKTSNITGDIFKSDQRLSEDLEITFNTFERKDHIGKAKKQHIKINVREKRQTLKPSTAKVIQEFDESKRSSVTDSKRQYIYELPSLLSSSGPIPRQLVAVPRSAGLRTGKK